MSHADEGQRLTPTPTRLTAGGRFILDAPAFVPAVWGEGNRVLWARGESLMIGGPPGVGKTTLAGQVIRARMVGGSVLGLPVEATASRVLYLAMDRPQQIARALRRTLGDLPRDVLDERLTAWTGPPSVDIARHPETLAGYAELAGADTLVVDSLKDAAIGLTDDEVAAGYNRARQIAIASGVEVVELHHVVKRGANGTAPNTLADLYGSAWLTAGAGSVVLLWGASGDPIVELRHLKSPAEEVGPWRVIHDHERGTSQVWHNADLVEIARAKGSAGVTAKDAARSLYNVASPKPSDVEKARRKLSALAQAGTLREIPGDKTTITPTVWTITETFTHPSDREGLHDTDSPSRSGGNPQVSTITETFTTFTAPDLHVPSPPYKGGNVRSCSVCGLDIDPTLPAVGEHTHPGCAA